MGNISFTNALTVLIAAAAGWIVANPQLIPPTWQPYLMPFVALLASLYHLHQPAPPPLQKP